MIPLMVFGFWYSCFSDGKAVENGYIEETAPTIEQATEQFAKEHNCRIYRIEKHTENGESKTLWQWQ